MTDCLDKRKKQEVNSHVFGAHENDDGSGEMSQGAENLKSGEWDSEAKELHKGGDGPRNLGVNEHPQIDKIAYSAYIASGAKRLTFSRGASCLQDILALRLATVNVSRSVWDSFLALPPWEALLVRFRKELDSTGIFKFGLKGFYGLAETCRHSQPCTKEWHVLPKTMNKTCRWLNGLRDNSKEISRAFR
ncbi:hypothetical protein PoB_001022100 [Plakobranchus ocellatus]|uniref:Uncharacterized protein n=1 Tax=Plakobranchus ocellatus TaxID=259542 RepID=A0AAV3YKB7_9GAST|nr:hypothetical protein PoB_001022100 [Plakobranchus ocellatus]